MINMFHTTFECYTVHLYPMSNMYLLSNEPEKP